MSDRKVLNPRLRSSFDHQVFLRKLGGALGVPIPDACSDVLSWTLPALDPDFRDAYLVKEVLRKYPGWVTPINPRTAALNSFLEQEERNRLTNLRLLDHRAGNPDVRSIFLAASRKVAMVLGKFRWDWFSEGLRFGPGSTTSLSLQEADLGNKLTRKPEVTCAAAEIAYEVISSTPLWAWSLDTSFSRDSLVIRDADEVTFVPKNWKTDRLIAIQPDMNVMLQLATAYVMRRKMARWGINLQDQQINGERARIASIDGSLATVDLENASNSITKSLVWQMVGNHTIGLQGSTFDPTWYWILNQIRTEKGIIDGLEHHYELFSAMGNGCTFELESLIFWALAVETCVHLGIAPDVTVYGDDIILPSAALPQFEEVLAFSGLRVNESKTFGTQSGPLFRESCGVHYLDGADVTPFYVDNVVDTVAECILLANNIVRWSKLPYGRDGRLLPVYNWVVGHLPGWARKTSIPFGLDDDGLIKTFDEAAPTVKRSKGVKRVKILGENGDFISQQVCWLPQRVGLKANTFKIVRRGKGLSPESALLVWHYQKSYKKVSNTTKDRHLRWLESLPVSYTPYSPAGLRASYELRVRVVTSWDDPGPWL